MKPLHHTVTYLHSTSHSLISPRIIGCLNFLRYKRRKIVPSNIFIFLTRKSRERKKRNREKKLWRKIMYTLYERYFVIRGLRLILQARYKNTRPTIFYNYTVITIVCSYTIIIEFVFNKRQVPWLHILAEAQLFLNIYPIRSKYFCY